MDDATTLQAEASLPHRRHADFRKLWAAQTISLIGSKISFLALPFTAIEILHVSPLQMGYLSAVGSLPALLFGLLAGVWVDRRARRPLMILADLARALLLLAIALAAWNGVLRMPLLYAVVLVNGVFGLLFSVAYSSYLPTLAPRSQLVAANSKLELTHSAAEVIGPGLAGWLVQVLSAPGAILLDALSYLLSALCLVWIRRVEPSLAASDDKRRIGQEISAGLRFVTGNTLLRALLGCTATASFFNAILEAVFLLYFTQHLGLSALQLGIIFGAGSVGFLFGALLPPQFARTIGIGPSIIIGLVTFALADFVSPLVAGPPWLIMALLMAAQACFGLGLTLFSVGQVSVRQAGTPDALQGRMNATFDFAVSGIVPLGALVGGIAGELIGLRTTLLLAAAGELLSVAWLLCSPLRTLQAPPEVA